MTQATKSLRNAKQIGLACREYAVDHHGSYPPSLEALFPDYLSDRAVLKSPLQPAAAIGFIYHPGFTDTSPPKAVLLEDKFTPSKAQRIVVHVDDSAAVQMIH